MASDTKDLPIEELPTKELSSEELPTKELFAEKLATDLTAEELPKKDSSTEKLSTKELLMKDLPTEELTTEELPFNEFSIEEFSSEEFSNEELSTEEFPTDEFPTDELPRQELPTKKLPNKECKKDDTDETLFIRIPLDVLSVNFNQDNTCFTCCMENGLRIYNSEPLGEHTRLLFEAVGSISQAQMIYRSNIIGMVSGGSRPLCPDNILRIFCFRTDQFVREIACHASIIAFRMRKDMLVIASLNHIHVFSFPEPTELLFTLETPTNSNRLLEVSPSIACEKQILIFPGQKTGSLNIVHIADAADAVKKILPEELVLTQSDQNGEKTLAFPIQAHESELCCIALNHQGTKIATASVHGTLIRIWDVETRTQVVELRRGSDEATIYSMSFSLNTEYLGCSSDKGTLHIFAIEKLNLNKRLSVPNATNVLGKYGESLWAFVNITLPPECACVVGFGKNSTVIALGMDGTFHQYKFSEDGTSTREIYNVYLNCVNHRFDYSYNY